MERRIDMFYCLEEKGMKKKTLFLLFCFSYLALLIVGCGNNEITNVDYKKARHESDIKHEKYIAHAGGSIEGVSYTNCKEAINSSYSKGYRFIELDFISTADDIFIKNPARTLPPLIAE